MLLRMRMRMRMMMIMWKMKLRMIRWRRRRMFRRMKMMMLRMRMLRRMMKRMIIMLRKMRWRRMMLRKRRWRMMMLRMMMPRGGRELCGEWWCWGGGRGWHWGCWCGGGWPIPRQRCVFCASLRSWNALGHFTRATLRRNLQGKCRRPEWTQNTDIHTSCEPAQSKCTSTFHKSHFIF